MSPGQPPTDARPRLACPDGRPLPAALRLLHALAVDARSPVRGVVQRCIWRLLAHRLPSIVATYPDGRCFVAPRHDVMYAEIFMFGAYEPDESRIVAQLLRDGEFAIDVGANHGWYSLLMASRVGGGGRVWAIEPAPPLVTALRANLARNRELPVEVLPVALGTSEGEEEIHLFRGLPHGHASASTLGRDDYSTYRVPKRALDELVSEAADAVPTLIKVDVEGGELDVLRGAAQLAGGERAPMWMIEVNHKTSAAFGYDPADLLHCLRSAGPYRAYRIDGRALRPETEPEHAPHGTTWICIPPAHEDRLQAAAGDSHSPLAHA